MEVLCDVTNPLFGPTGAAWIYGRQKGGTDETLTELDDGLRHIADAGEGAAGPRCRRRRRARARPAAWAMAPWPFSARTLRRGIEIVLDMTGFDAAARDADLIITGEGHLDGQSAQGKLIQGLCGRARETPVIALCGKLSASPDQVETIGLKAAYCINAGRTPAGGDAGQHRRQSGKDRRRADESLERADQRAVFQGRRAEAASTPPCPAPWDDGR